MILKDINWNPGWFVNVPNEVKFPHAYWRDKENQREFLRNLERRFSVAKPSDWGKIICRRVIEEGGGSLLNIHGGSIYKTLQSAFPGIFKVNVNLLRS